MINRALQNTQRHSLLRLCVLMSICFSALATATEDANINQSTSISEIVSLDYKNFYSTDRLARMGLVFAGAGIVANTNMDMSIRNWYQDKVRSSQTNSTASNPQKDFTLNAKFFGEGKYLVPVALLSSSINLITPDTAVGNWGAYASRAYITGLPAMWLMQIVTGASRPGETPEGSTWRPFNDDNGVSGHAFIGTVPFLTLAKMNPENNFIKYPAYIASAAAAWSRVNDDKHFTSQVVLGWYMAWEAVDTVFSSNEKNKSLTITPIAGLDGFGLMAQGSW